MRSQKQSKTVKQRQKLTKQASYTFALSPSYATVQPLDNTCGEISYRFQPLSPCYCKRARSTRNEAWQVKRGAFGRMRKGRRHRALGGRSFMGAGNKTTFMMTNARPEGRPYAPTHLSRSLIAGRSAMRRGGFR